MPCPYLSKILVKSGISYNVIEKLQNYSEILSDLSGETGHPRLWRAIWIIGVTSVL